MKNETAIHLLLRCVWMITLWGRGLHLSVAGGAGQAAGEDAGQQRHIVMETGILGLRRGLHLCCPGNTQHYNYKPINVSSHVSSSVLVLLLNPPSAVQACGPKVGPPSAGGAGSSSPPGALWSEESLKLQRQSILYQRGGGVALQLVAPLHHT